MHKTTIYKYNDMGNLDNIKTIRRKFYPSQNIVHYWKKGDVICYTVTRDGKLLDAGVLPIPEVLKIRRKLKPMRAVFYRFDKRTLIEIFAHLKKAKGGK